MNTFVPCGADYYAGGMALDLRRLGKQLVEVQQIHMALTTGEPAHILHHPATQMWAGLETQLLWYGSEMYSAYIKQTGRPHSSGEYADSIGLKRPVLTPPDWLPDLAKLHQTKLYRKDPTHYAQWATDADDVPRYPVTKGGRTINWVTRRGSGWVLDGDDRTFKTAWAAIQFAREGGHE